MTFKALTTALTLGLVAFAQSALADTFTTSTGVVVTSTAGAPTGPFTIDFDTNGAAGVFTNGASLSGNYGIYNGAAGPVVGSDGTDHAAPPLGDVTNYLSVPVNGPTGTATLSFGKDVQSLSFYWGSIDPFNSISLLNGSGAVFDTITGADVSPNDTGSQTSASSNRTISLALAAGQTLSGLQFSSGNYALETDDYKYTVSAAPEPSAWLLIIAGVGVVGLATRRRPQGAVRAAVA